MASKKSNRKQKHLQPVELAPIPHIVAMHKLGLDWHAIDLLAEDYKSSGSDEHLVITIVLLKRLLNLAELREKAPESIDNYLSLLIDRLYRATYHCEGAADLFAKEADEEQRSKSLPTLVENRRVS
jgi:hypothetical protein